MASTLGGVIPPLVTPLLAGGTRLDSEGLIRMIDYTLQGGCNGIFVAGSTGEVSALAEAEWLRLVKTTAAHVAGRVPVLVGVSDTGTERAARKAELAAEAGADYALATTGFYLRFGPEEHQIHYRELARRSPVPLIVYNVPPATGTVLDAGTLRRLAEIPNIAGLKDSSGDYESFAAVAPELEAAGWRLFLGTEALNHLAAGLGAHGTIPGLANLAPALCSSAFAAGATGDAQGALANQRKLWSLARVYRQGGGSPTSSALAGLKHALSLLGLCRPDLSAPLRPLNAAEADRVAAVLREEGLL